VRRPDSVEQRVVSWLEGEAEVDLPDRVLRQTFEGTRHLPQHRGRIGRRYLAMSRRAMNLAVGAAAVALVAVAGLVLIRPGAGPGAGGLSQQPVGTASVSPSPASAAQSSAPATPAASSRASALATAAPNDDGSPRALETIEGRLEPGTYAISAIEPLEIRFTVPAGWERPPNAPEFLGPTGQSGREIGGLSFWTPDRVYADPCRASLDHVLELSPEASEDDVTDALAAVWGDALTTPEDVSVSGFDGAHVAVTNACATVEYWVLDVDGVRVVMVAHTWPETSPTEAAELQQIVDSVEIEP
jgi:hypothetical protein